jgi:HEPN domain-containing protein
MNDEPLEEWLERAEEDYHQAQVALRQKKYPAYNSVCFHAQQCAEKYVKAFLVRHHLRFRKTHDLIRLKILCMEADTAFDLISNALALLFPYAIDARYPGFRATEQDARDAVAAMKQVRKFVRARLGLATK